MSVGEEQMGSIELLGCPIDQLDMRTTVNRCLEIVEQRAYGQHIAMNAAKLVAYQSDPELRSIVAQCELVNADGQSLVWASRLLGKPLPERVAGIDLMNELLAAAAARGLRVYILGARGEVLERAIARLTELHPGLLIAGYRDGYFGDGEVPAVCDEIRDAGPDMLFVAMSSPAKERFLANHGRALGVPFVMGVGGAVDVLAGVTRRAPASWRRLGVEWLYRLLQEPRRLGPRYLRTNGRFIALVARQWWRGRR
jgi:N-acetylglucosaminyldiphosphoundecaprenol N-acetyl-beta-D-mannosaminyltransferase